MKTKSPFRFKSNRALSCALFIRVLLALCVLGSLASLNAVTIYYWGSSAGGCGTTSTGSGCVWNTATNWSPNATAATLSGATVVVGTGSNHFSNENITGLSLGTLTISSGYTVTVLPGASLTLSSGGTNSGTLNNSAYNGTSSSTLTINGTFNNTGGIIANYSASSLSAVHLTNATIDNGTLAGTIYSGGTSTLSGVTNLNTFLVTAATSSVTVTGGTNSGLMGGYMDTSRVLNFINTNYNSGTIEADHGTVNIGGTLVNTGGTINGDSGALTIVSGATVEGGGTLEGTISATGATISGTGANPVTLSNLTLTGGTTTGTIHASGTNALDPTNTGTLTVMGGSTTFTGANSGTLAGSGGTLDVISSTNTGTIKSIGGTVLINDILANNGGILNNSSGTLTIDTGATVQGGTLEGAIGATGATISGSTNAVTLTTATVTGGTYTGTISAAGSTMSGVGAGNTVTFSNATVTNGTLQGTISAYGTNALTGTTNENLFSVTGGTTTFKNGTNNGTLQATGGGVLDVIGAGTTNAGTIQANGGTVAVAGTVSNAGGTINRVSGTLTVYGTVIGGNVSGTVQGTTSGVFDAVNFLNATVTLGSASLSDADGEITSNGVSSINVANAGAVDLEVQSGTLSVVGDYDIAGGKTTEVDGGAALDVLGGSISNNGGTLTIDPTGLVDPTSYTQDSGTLSLNGTLDVATVNLLGGTIGGTGDFAAGTTVNNGTNSGNGGDLYVPPGSGSPEPWDFANYNQTADGTVTFDLDAVSNVPSYDYINLTGEVTPGGTLDLDITNAMLTWMLAQPFGTEIVLIQSAEPFGDVGYYDNADRFTAVTGTPMPQYWTVLYGPNDVYLELAPEPAPYLLMGGAIMALGLIRRRRRAKA